MQTILITGGAGYIGSHTVVELLQANYAVIILDNFCNSSPKAIERIKTITGKTAPKHSLTCIEGDVRDSGLLANIFSEYPVHGVIHFAGLKAVGQSTKKPLDYYDNNLIGTIALCKAMQKAGVYKLVFSSSATVYGEDAIPPYTETMPRGRTTSPYGTSKAMIEQILSDLCASNQSWAVAQLRYFNPIGAHKSGLIGEDPTGIPNNLLPYISQVAVGKLEKLKVYGGDYPTPDGTGIRDYIHVVDLAQGHVKALEKIQQLEGEHIWNLGTGRGHSVLEVIKAFEEASNQPIKYSVEARRAGDIAAFWADPAKTKSQLGWETQLELKDMVADTWHWQSKNPNGYDS
jgi:UDP-glucose 4-epimerase